VTSGNRDLLLVSGDVVLGLPCDSDGDALEDVFRGLKSTLAGSVVDQASGGKTTGQAVVIGSL
jgi:hypothetical protein